MSRLFRSLGFAGFDEVRDAPPLAAQRGRAASGRTPAARRPSSARCRAPRPIAVAPRGSRAIEEAVDLLAGAGRVLVLGWRNSHAVALHLRQQLAQARADVRLAPAAGAGGRRGARRPRARRRVVVIGLPPTPARASRCSWSGPRHGCRGRAGRRPHGCRSTPAAATVFLECPVDSGLAFDSYAAAMSLVSVLADGVLRRVGRPGSERTARISRAYQDLREVE